MPQGHHADEECPFPEWMAEFKGERKDDQRQVIFNMLKATPDKDVTDVPGVPRNLSVKDARIFLRKNLSFLAESMYAVFDKGLMKAIEDRWFEETKVLLPPPELMSRHPGFKESLDEIYETEELSDKAWREVSPRPIFS